MKTVMVIPSYWSRASDCRWREGDAVYDHPTPLDHDGTLLRALDSLSVLEDKDFQVAVIAVPTAADIADAVEDRVSEIIASVSPKVGVDISLFGPSALKNAHRFLAQAGRADLAGLVRLDGYANVRNLCLFVPHLRAAETAVLIDDDEIFEDPAFMAKAREYVGGQIDGKPAYGIAGYYLQADGGYRLRKPHRPWMTHWDQTDRMNEAFDRFIGTDPRLKETPFVFGGNMIIDRRLFTQVPFDPLVRRGEDIDFLINARMCGFHFFLDNQLAVKHLAPGKTHPFWRQWREDIYRFVYQRAKIDAQTSVPGMVRVAAADFDPYPGRFLRADLEDKVAAAARLLAEEYIREGDERGAQETMRNIAFAAGEARPANDPFADFLTFMRSWREMTALIDDERSRGRLGGLDPEGIIRSAGG